MTTRNKTAIFAAAVPALVITGYSGIRLLGTGTLSWHIRQPETAAMMVELGLIWLMLFLLFSFAANRLVRAAGVIALVAGFSWLHQMFFPVLLSGLYIGYVILAGRCAARILKRERLGLAWEFCIGSILVILVFCIFSLMHLGSIRNLRIWSVVTGLLLAGVEVIRRWPMKADGSRLPDQEAAPAMPAALTIPSAAMWSAVFTLVLLQAGRMNLAVDFDSIWYGVRSYVMLDSGNGFYENLGSLGVVYTYPKGWEVLTLPLSGLPSYAFSTAFNVWVSAMVLLSAFDTAVIWMKKERAVWVPFLMAAVPGIMNMAVTAKADMLTLFFQILMLQAMLRFIRDRRTEHLAYGLAAGGISLTMKPTALVFSSAIVGMSMIWLLLDRRKAAAKQDSGSRYIRSDIRIWMLVLSSAAALAGIWGRTLKLVGVPVTSVFYQVFQKLGFQVKYPFYAAAFPEAGHRMSAVERIGFYARRLYGVLLNPQGDDMAHVIIAWGALFPLVFLLLRLLFGRRPKEGAVNHALEYLTLVMAGVLLVNLVSLYSLFQIDGNYYILFYALLIICGCIWLDSKGLGLWQGGTAILMIPWVYAVILCCVTNWAWSLGFSPVQVRNPGYYNHTEYFRREHEQLGSQQIWNELARSPRTRVIALGEHPRVLTFPCNVQSYVDVSGYWGNPEVVSDPEHFLEYLHYANTDYIYMEQQYVDTSVRIYQIIRTLIQRGWLYDVRDENGNLIIRVAHDEPVTEAVDHNLTIFDERYIQHPQGEKNGKNKGTKR